MSCKKKLGVNIDHVATLRQARGGDAPDVLAAARECMQAGADSIVVHLREDRRHIQDEDVFRLRRLPRMRLNLEMSVASEIVDIACRVVPDQSTLVPEKRLEVTTEGGLDVVGLKRRIRSAVTRLKKKGIRVSLFIEPDERQIRAAKEVGALMIELHTGRYAAVCCAQEKRAEFLKLKSCAVYAHKMGLFVAAGHGLDYKNVSYVAALDCVGELNIGYSIVCRSVFVGLHNAVREMKERIAGVL